MPKKDIKPGYFSDKPVFKSISKLKKSIGLQDSSIQTNELAIRFLKDHYVLADEKEVYFDSLFQKYNISRGTLNFSQFTELQYKSYILHTYNLIEPLLKKLSKEYRYFNNYTKEWIRKDGDKDLDPFNQLLANLTRAKSNYIKKFPEYNLLNYYRLVRNSIVHLQLNHEEQKKTKEYYNQCILPLIGHFKFNYELDAPNSPESLDFQDFMIYTRSIKYFANILNDACFPTIEKLVDCALNDVELQNKLMQSRYLNYEGALLKRINTLRGFIRTHFKNSKKDLLDEFCRNYLAREGTKYSKYL